MKLPHTKDHATMTCQDDFTLSALAFGSRVLGAAFHASGLGRFARRFFKCCLNAAMQIERQKHLGAAPHERTEERTGHANGYKDKTLNTRLGQITVAVPASARRKASTHSLWSAAPAPSGP